MASTLRIHFDHAGNSLTVWFDDPRKETVCEETAGDVILMKDRQGRVIGFERLNYLSAKQRASRQTIPVEVQMA